MGEVMSFKVRGFKSFQTRLHRDQTRSNPKYFNRTCNVDREKKEALIGRARRDSRGEAERKALEYFLEELDCVSTKLPRYEFKPNGVYSDKAHVYEELGLMTYSRKTQLLFSTRDSIVELFSLFPITKVEALGEIIKKRLECLDYDRYPFIPRQSALKFVSRSVLGEYDFEFEELPKLNFLGELFLGINEEFDQQIEKMVRDYRKGSLFLHEEFVNDLPSGYDLRSLFVYMALNDMQILVHAKLLKVLEKDPRFIITSKSSGVTVAQALREEETEFPSLEVQGYCDQSLLRVEPLVSTGMEALRDYLSYYSSIVKELEPLRVVS